MKIYPLSYELDKPYILRLNEVSNYFPPHRHDFLEFSYIIKGQGIEIINGHKHKLEKGVFTLLLPYQIHELQPEPGNTLKIYNCNLGLEAFFGSNKFSGELNEIIFDFNEELPSYVTFQEKEARRVENIFQAMFAEIKEDKLWSGLIFKAKLIELLALFDRARRLSAGINTHPKDYRGDKKGYLWEVIFYIHNHYQEEMPLEKLASRFGVSASHLSTSFKEYFGENLHSFLNEIRIKQACGLLVSSSKQITEIATEVGFNSYTTFSRVFRQKMGLSASEYKERLQ